ncbi:type II toxin-antitoxin system MqsR family toxin [Stenotrophomonas acidaminiphila]|uniref:type II toxin-antitoxin system MqsR family toxin n=1 Tax=Stenotrophomonas acidaminiphila TaxID=128780 RepID=UPI0020C5BAC9|nr:type II toxin-antitoxin system MqsR family toxin [Stenotrophomonas acidaminiphila]
MEKKSAHYPLHRVKAVVADLGMDCFTGSARRDLVAMGLTPQEALDTIAALRPSHCYKSMTTKADHRVWQDVYHCATTAGKAYVKFTLIEPTPEQPTPRVVISFKEL